VDLTIAGLRRYLGALDARYHHQSAFRHNTLFAFLAFDAGNRLAVRRAGTRLGSHLSALISRSQPRDWRRTSSTIPRGGIFHGGRRRRQLPRVFSQVEGAPADDEVQFLSLEHLAAGRADLVRRSPRSSPDSNPT